MENLGREACATIRGYNYQFDSSIRAILSLGETEVMVIERLEDFDILYSDFTSLYQCKYLASSSLTPSALRDAILPMIERFHEIDYPQQKLTNYHLYGYFKDSSECAKRLSYSELKDCLKQSKIEKNDKGESFRKKINLQELLQIDDEELQAFAQRLTIHITKEYELHKIQTIKDLGQHLDITPDESTNFYYPSAFSLIAHKAGSNEESNRKITKKQFVDYLKTAKEVVYSRWNRKEVGEERFHRDLRNRYFSATNIDNNDRYFIIEVVQSDSLAQIFYVIMEIRKKWSSHSIKRKPDMM